MTIAAALEYNRRQGHSQDEVKLIQEVTGSTADGLWGPRSVRAVAVWQREQKLTPDGKVGPKTLQAIRQEALADAPADTIPPPPPGPIKHGVWVDDPVKMVVKPTYAQKLKALGFSEAALMTNRSNTRKGDTPWDLLFKDRGEPGWEDDDIARIAENLHANDVEIIFTCWPLPTKRQIDAMIKDMRVLIAMTQARAFEVDTEGNWMTKHMDGSFASLEDAAAYLVAGMKSAAAGSPGCRTEMTTFASHGELGRLPTVTPLVDLVLGQAYSVADRGDRSIPFDSKLGPGRHQRRTIERARRAGAKRSACALAAWNQNFDGASPGHAMTVAYDMGLSLGCDIFRWWSSKWIFGIKSNAYAERWFANHLPT